MATTAEYEEDYYEEGMGEGGEAEAEGEGDYYEEGEGGEEGGEGLDDDAMAEQLAQEEAKLKAEEAELKAASEAGAGASAAADGAAGAGVNLDENSVYVGQVDYEVTPEELQAHFSSCGTINRVTILCDKFGHPRGFAYVEFLETASVENALKMDNSLLKGRSIKVTKKRVNVHGFNRGRGRGGFRGRGFVPRGRGGFRPRGRGYRGGFRGGYRGYRPYY